jgi:sugar lactone lactonase YvrE
MRTATTRLVPVLLALGLAVVFSPAASANYAFVTKWGSDGSGDGQFRAPYDVAAGLGGTVYVTDFGSNHRVEKFSSDGAFLTKWGSLGSGDAQFTNPWGIATDSGGDVYVADTGNHCVKKFDSDGVFIGKIGEGGDGNGQFNGPVGVALDSSGNVYATDYNGAQTINRVQKFAPIIGSYAYADQWGVTGTESGKFREPHDVAVDAAGNVYVSERANNRIQKFDSEGNFLAEWGGMGSADGQFVFPEGIGTDQAGNVYVADRGNNRVQKFSSSGTFLTKWGATGSADGQFLQPNDVAVDSSGNVYVADTGNDRIQKFAETGASSGGSAGNFGGDGNGAQPADGKLEIKGVSSSTKDGKIKFQLELPAPGVVEATARVIPPPRPPSLNPDQREHETGHRLSLAKRSIVAAKVKAVATRPGSFTVALAPNARTREFLRWKKTLKAEVKITYTPTGGAPSSTVRSAKFKRKKDRAPSRKSG